MKTDSKGAADIDASNLASKSHLAGLKAEIDQIQLHKKLVKKDGYSKTM